jgi:hypothetical protein
LGGIKTSNFALLLNDLNQAVKHNIERFPDDFMFQLTADEFDNLRFQSDTSNLRSQIVTLRLNYVPERNKKMQHCKYRCLTKGMTAGLISSAI